MAKKLKPVIVEWTDACATACDEVPEMPTMISCGFLHYKDDERIVISGMYDEEDRATPRTSQVIPASLIKKITRL